MEKNKCGNKYLSLWLAVDCKAINKKLKYANVLCVRCSRGQVELEGQSAAIKSIASQIGFGPETLRGWVRRAETGSGRRDGVTTASFGRPTKSYG